MIENGSMCDTVVDCAGAVGGGAARFLRELDSYLRHAGRPDIQVIGRNRRLNVKWLLEREYLSRKATRLISLNNAGFVSGNGCKITLLRNILHFATSEDLRKLGFRPSAGLRAQVPVIRKFAEASDYLVVPCSRMADQVAQVSPKLADRLVVRFHPVAVPAWAGTPPERAHDILVPIVPQPYKNLDQHVAELLDAVGPKSDIRILIPARRESLGGIGDDARVCFIGPQSSSDLEHWWRGCAAVFFPVEFESFGYALAESRVYGRSVIAQDTAQNREIAGSALRPYTRGRAGSLKIAVSAALSNTPAPEPMNFDPSAYFDWLLSTIGT